MSNIFNNGLNKAKSSAILDCYKNSDSIEKSGEGSRGGKIIGHTKLGKAIYEDHNHLKSRKIGTSGEITIYANSATHQEDILDPYDHAEAAHLHYIEAKNALDVGNINDKEYHKNQHDIHREKAASGFESNAIINDNKAKNCADDLDYDSALQYQKIATRQRALAQEQKSSISISPTRR